jgi:MFS family permease
VLSLYQWTAYLASGIGQLLVNLADVRALVLYIVAALLLCMSLVPVVLTHVQGPDISRIRPLPMKELYRISPLGVAGCFGAGIMSGSFYGLGPIYGQEVGLSIFEVSLFMGAAILGGLILQWPIGRLSDRFDRRTVLLFVLIAVAVAFGAMYMMSATGIGSTLVLLGMPVLFGGAMSTIYPIAVSHAFDYVSRDRMIAASSGLLLAWAIGSTVGPFAVSLLMGRLGPAMLFLFLAATTGVLAAFAAYRMSRRAALPSAEQATFVPLPPTGDVAGALDPRAAKGANLNPPKQPAAAAAAG